MWAHPPLPQGSLWAPVSAIPLSDAAAAALVIDIPEQVLANVAANNYVPTSGELATFHAANFMDRANFDHGPAGDRDPLPPTS